MVDLVIVVIIIINIIVIFKVRDDPSFMVDLATGRGAASLLRHKFSSLTARFRKLYLFLVLSLFLSILICCCLNRMKPYMDARSSSTPSAASYSSASSSASMMSCSSSSCSAMSHTWNPQPGLQYSFSGKGCRFWILLSVLRFIEPSLFQAAQDPGYQQDKLSKENN